MNIKPAFLLFISAIIFSCKKDKLDADCQYFDYNLSYTFPNIDTNIVIDYKTQYSGAFEYIGFTYQNSLQTGPNLYMRGGGIHYAYIPGNRIYYYTSFPLNPFTYNQKIDSTFLFDFTTTFISYNSYSPTEPKYNLFSGKGDMFIGFKVIVGNWNSKDSKYGWIKINLSSDGRTFRIINGALNKNINEPILAGKCN